MKVLAVCRGAPGLGRVTPSLALTETLAKSGPLDTTFASYAAGTRYLAARAEEVVDLGAPEGLFIDPVSSQALRILELAEQDSPDLVLIDGEFVLLPTLAHLPVPVVYLANPHDLLGALNPFRRVNRLLLAHADAVLILSLACRRPTPHPGLLPGTPCLELPAVTKDISLCHRPSKGTPRVLVSTGGGSLGADPAFRAATDIALARVLDVLSEQVTDGRVSTVTVVLGADASLTGKWLRPPRWLHVVTQPVEIAAMYPDHDLLITRAGRNTTAEAAYCGIPAVLLPVTSDQHRGSEQTANAGAVAHLRNIFNVPQWLDHNQLRQAIRRALDYAMLEERVTGQRGNEPAAAFIAGILRAAAAQPSADQPPVQPGSLTDDHLGHDFPRTARHPAHPAR
jgi:hypothetical protein